MMIGMEDTKSDFLNRVIRVWQEELQIESIGTEDDFFELGGTSMVAIRIVTRLRTEVAFRVPPLLLYEEPTPRRLVDRLWTMRAAQESC
jgi:acyl carrier protein